MAGSVIEVFVAENGNDAWPGTVDRPVASLSQARNLLRNLRKPGTLLRSATVFLREGRYFLTEPFLLNPEDSGTEVAPVTYRAYPGETPVISGGRTITGWKKAGGELWKAELPEVRKGRWLFRQLFVNGRRRVRARVPEEGKFFVHAGPFSERDDEPRNKTSFRYNPGDIRKWDHYHDAEVVYIHRFDISRMNIVAIDETEKVVEFSSETLFPYAKQSTSRYWVENI